MKELVVLEGQLVFFALGRDATAESRSASRSEKEKNFSQLVNEVKNMQVKLKVN